MKGLKAFKELKKRYGKNFSLQDDMRSHTIEKELKALEIIAKYGLANYWKIGVWLELSYITQEEYDLLKEVLK